MSEIHCDSCEDSGCRKCAYGQDKANAALGARVKELEADLQAAIASGEKYREAVNDLYEVALMVYEYPARSAFLKQPLSCLHALGVGKGE